MPTGAITEYIDVAQIALYVFWAFFAALIFYIRREDKREGYPLESDRSEQVPVVGFPPLPKPKTFKLGHGGTYEAPNDEVDDRPIAAKPMAPWPGAPLEPTGDPMRDGVGPAAWAERADHPETTLHGEPRIVPMRVATGFSVAPEDPDPRGMKVFGSDGERAGKIRDIWVDRAEPQIRYLEVETETETENETENENETGKGGAGASRRVLLPIGFASIDGRRRLVQVSAILGRHFAAVPVTRQADEVTQLEEDRICAFYGGGTLYAVPARQEALL